MTKSNYGESATNKTEALQQENEEAKEIIAELEAENSHLKELLRECIPAAEHAKDLGLVSMIKSTIGESEE